MSKDAGLESVISLGNLNHPGVSGTSVQSQFDVCRACLPCMYSTKELHTICHPAHRGSHRQDAESTVIYALSGVSVTLAIHYCPDFKSAVARPDLPSLQKFLTKCFTVCPLPVCYTCNNPNDQKEQEILSHLQQPNRRGFHSHKKSEAP